MYTIVITSSNEPETIKIAVEHILATDKAILKNLEIIVVAPDKTTLDEARNTLDKKKFKNYSLIKDNAKGKANALNMAVAMAKGDILIFTDGDMYIDKKAIPALLNHFDSQRKQTIVAGISGNPRPLNSRNNLFGFFAHIHCNIADEKRFWASPSSEDRRQNDDRLIPMSGYLFAIKNIPGIFPLPKNLKAEDAYVSLKLKELGYKIDYEKNAFAYVMFPSNVRDWLKQKTRSLGGNYQLNKYFNAKNIPKRNIFEDIKETFYLFSYVKTPKEFFYLLCLYPLRLILWIKIIFNHSMNNYNEGTWDRIESTKTL